MVLFDFSEVMVVYYPIDGYGNPLFCNPQAIEYDVS